MSPVAAQGPMRVGGLAGNKRLRSEEAEVPELTLLRKTNQVWGLMCHAGAFLCVPAAVCMPCWRLPVCACCRVHSSMPFCALKASVVQGKKVTCIYTCHVSCIYMCSHMFTIIHTRPPGCPPETATAELPLHHLSVGLFCVCLVLGLAVLSTLQLFADHVCMGVFLCLRCAGTAGTCVDVP